MYMYNTVMLNDCWSHKIHDMFPSDLLQGFRYVPVETLLLEVTENFRFAGM